MFNILSTYPKLKAVQDSVLLQESSQLSRLVATFTRTLRRITRGVRLTWVLLTASDPSLRPGQRTEKHPEMHSAVW